MNMDIVNCPPGPLHGIRVVDLTTVMFGPYCTQIMGEMGADVIKVESPEGDIGRQTGATRSPGMSAAHLMKGRNKRSVVLDLKQAVGNGLTVRPIRKVWENVSTRGTFKLHWWMAEYVGGELALNAAEVSDARWLTVDEICRLDGTFEGDREFYRKILPSLAS